jgi:hypothetical protein
MDSRTPDEVVQLEEKDRQRFAVFQAGYELSEGSERRYVNFEEIISRTGLSRQQIKEAYEYLVGEGLLVYRGFGGICGITHRGIKEYEQSLRQPNKSTAHFSATVIQHIHTFNAPVGTVQTGENSTANVVQGVGSPPLEIDALIQALLVASDTLSSEDRRQVHDQMGELRAELTSPAPKPSRIKAFLAGAWNAAENATVLKLAEKLGHPLHRR